MVLASDGFWNRKTSCQTRALFMDLKSGGFGERNI